MNLFELTKLDVKDLGKIDYQKLLKDLQKKPDVIAVIVLVIFTLIFCIRFYSHRQQELTKFNTEISTLEQKIKAVESYTSTKSELDEFVTKLPRPVTEEQLINRVTDWAEKHNIQIQSFSPARKQVDPLYDLISISINVSAKDYSQMWLFIHDIEKSNFAIRVDRWVGSMGENTNRGRQNRSTTNTSTNWINAQIEISAINFKSG